MRGSVSVFMNAEPSIVWSLVSDVTRVGEFSPETFEAEWLGGATEPAVGAKFRGHVKRNGVGPVYWTVCQVTEFEPERVFEFAVLGGKAKVNNWRYELTTQDGGTLVTESFRLGTALPMKIYWTLLGRFRGKTNEDGMRTTLERMKKVAESESAARD